MLKLFKRKKKEEKPLKRYNVTIYLKDSKEPFKAITKLTTMDDSEYMVFLANSVEYQDWLIISGEKDGYKHMIDTNRVAGAELTGEYIKK